jgi:hypothetical protein
MAKWSDLTQEERAYTVQAMRQFGGGFASALAEVLYSADASNAERLGESFDDIVQRYGPASDFYRRVVETA